MNSGRITVNPDSIPADQREMIDAFIEQQVQVQAEQALAKAAATAVAVLPSASSPSSQVASQEDSSLPPEQKEERQAGAQDRVRQTGLSIDPKITDIYKSTTGPRGNYYTA